LELPEDTFVNMHRYDAVGETYGMYFLFLPLIVDKLLDNFPKFSGQSAS
jgi:hypothetical protein